MRQTDTGALIAQLRKEQGLTQKQLAEQLHISDRTISKWERGVSSRCALYCSNISWRNVGPAGSKAIPI